MVRTIAGARKSIVISAYKITSIPIAKALTQAHARGVRVDVILDKSQRTDKYSSATFLLNHGIRVRIDVKHAIHHNKVMIIDGETVITGSFNFTQKAENQNAENLLIVRDKILAEMYIKNWKLHDKYSEPYTLMSQKRGQGGSELPGQTGEKTLRGRRARNAQDVK